MRLRTVSHVVPPLLLSLTAPAAADAQTAGQSAIDWRVKDRFRLFDRASPDARARVTAAADEIASAGQSSFARHYWRLLATLSGSDGSTAHSASLRGSNYQPAPDEGPRTSGRYASDYLYPDQYSIELRVPAAPPEAICTYRSTFGVQSGRCGEWTTLAVADGPTASRNNWTVSTRVEVEAPGLPAHSVDISFRDQFIVAIGDSYISGEGNPDVPSVITDRADDVFEHSSWGSRIELSKHVLREAEWWDEPCHRSLLSWPVLASFVHSARNPRHAVTLVHLGCSGAVARDLYLHGETELPGGGDERQSQLALLDGLMSRPDERWARRKIDRVLLSIGGNDAGFVGVIATLTLPPNGFMLGNWVAGIIGDEAGAVCPYDNTAMPLLRLCNDRFTAQGRLRQLSSQFEAVEASLRVTFGVRAQDVYQPLYPNSLLTEDSVLGGTVPCDTNPRNDPRETIVRRREGERRRSAESPGQRPASRPIRATGFEAFMGVIPRFARGFLYDSWNFEFRYDPEDVDPDRPLLWAPGARCDAVIEPGDSEVCQALWVHDELNRLVTDNDFTAVSGHMDAIVGHGLCRETMAFPLAMPKVRDHQWVGRTPQSVDPYAFDNPRWFRTPNDSIVTQFSFYGDERRFHHGTVHPTYRSHIEIADAVYKQALQGSLPEQ